MSDWLNHACRDVGKTDNTVAASRTCQLMTQSRDSVTDSETIAPAPALATCVCQSSYVLAAKGLHGSSSYEHNFQVSASWTES